MFVFVSDPGPSGPVTAVAEPLAWPEAVLGYSGGDPLLLLTCVCRELVVPVVGVFAVEFVEPAA